MIRLPIKGRNSTGLYALIDDVDAPKVAGYVWYLCPTLQGRTYVQGRRPPGPMIRLHRLIMDAPKGMDVDHIDSDATLDCRRSNLRVCTRAFNLHNSRSRGGASRFKGVHRATNGHRWAARIRADGRNIHLGTFDREDAAAHAYDTAARAHFGAFGRYNFPRPGERSALREPSGDGQSSALPSLSPSAAPEAR
jgi:hypothetical protein